MLFRRGVSFAEALYVFPGECEEFHGALGLVGRSIAAAPLRSNPSLFPIWTENV
jgi:hypothetical protein